MRYWRSWRLRPPPTHPHAARDTAGRLPSSMWSGPTVSFYVIFFAGWGDTVGGQSAAPPCAPPIAAREGVDRAPNCRPFV